MNSVESADPSSSAMCDAVGGKELPPLPGAALTRELQARFEALAQNNGLRDFEASPDQWDGYQNPGIEGPWRYFWHGARAALAARASSMGAPEALKVPDHIARDVEQCESADRWNDGVPFKSRWERKLYESGFTAGWDRARALAPAAPVTSPSIEACDRCGTPDLCAKLGCASEAMGEEAKPAEPVAWLHEYTDPHSGTRAKVAQIRKPAVYEMMPGDTVRPLVFASPSLPLAAPLTEEQIDRLVARTSAHRDTDTPFYRDFARAIERAHGIGSAALSAGGEQEGRA